MILLRFNTSPFSLVSMMEAPPGGGEEEETGHKEEDAWSNPVVCRHIRKVVVWNTQENGAPSRSEMHELEIILSNWRTCDLGLYSFFFFFFFFFIFSLFFPPVLILLSQLLC